MAPKRLITSYAFDWLLIIAAVTISLLLSTVNPDFHTFCVLDMNISYPYRPAKLSISLFILLSTVLPVLVIIMVTFLNPSRPPQSLEHDLLPTPIRSQRLQYLNTSLLGLGVSLATSTVIVTGVKNLTRKPRPTLLSICDPDLENIEHFAVGSFGAGFSRLWVMVDVDICRQTDKTALRNGFRSFPSRMATIAFAGLLYLSLVLCHRFGVFFASGRSPGNILHAHVPDSNEGHESSHSNSSEPGVQPLGQEGDDIAGFPLYLLLLPYVPLGLAMFIAGTRYFDFRNHGFDVLAGAAIGSATAWVGYRIYHSSLGSERGTTSASVTALVFDCFDAFMAHDRIQKKNYI